MASKPVCMISISALKFPKVLIMGYKDVCKKELGARSPYVPFLVSTSLVICNITYNCFCGCVVVINFKILTKLHFITAVKGGGGLGLGFAWLV